MSVLRMCMGKTDASHCMSTADPSAIVTYTLTSSPPALRLPSCLFAPMGVRASFLGPLQAFLKCRSDSGDSSDGSDALSRQRLVDDLDLRQRHLHGGRLVDASYCGNPHAKINYHASTQQPALRRRCRGRDAVDDDIGRVDVQHGGNTSLELVLDR